MSTAIIDYGQYQGNSLYPTWCSSCGQQFYGSHYCPSLAGRWTTITTVQGGELAQLRDEIKSLREAITELLAERKSKRKST